MALSVIVVLVIIFSVKNSTSQEYPSYICYIWSSTNCYGGDLALTNTDLSLTYSYGAGEYSRKKNKSCVLKKAVVLSRYNFIYDNNTVDNGTKLATFSFQQLEHGGGKCNCVNIQFECRSNLSLTLCGGSASVPRRRKVEWTGNNNSINLITGDADTIKKSNPFQLTCNQPPYILISFQLFLHLNGDKYDRIDVLEEGVEFSAWLLSMPDEWIPIIYIHSGSNRTKPSLSIGNDFIRGYNVSREAQLNDDQPRHTLQICDFNQSDYIQFRWLQTSFVTNGIKDTWLLDNLEITVSTTDHGDVCLLNETFTELNSKTWPHDHVRNAEVWEYSNSNSGLVFFSNFSDRNTSISSRSLLTNPFSIIFLNQFLQNLSDVNNAICIDRTFSYNQISTNRNYYCTMGDTTNITIETSTNTTIYPNKLHIPKTTTDFTTNSGSIIYISTSPTSINSSSFNIPNDISINLEYIETLEKEILHSIISNKQLSQVISSENSITKFLSLLNFTKAKVISSLELVYIYSTSIRSLSNSTFSKDFLEVIVTVGYELLKSQSLIDSRQQLIVGTTVLFSLDILMFTYFPPSFSYIITSSGSNTPQFCAFITKMVNLTGLSDLASITVIDTNRLHGLGKPQLSLSIPVNLLRKYAIEEGEIVKITSSVCRHVSNVFTSAIRDENSTLGPDIVSSSIQCGLKSCSTSNYSLKTSYVTITFGHSSMIKEALTSDANLEVVCVFLEPTNNLSSLLNIGYWSTRGCTRNTRLSSTTKTVCECNHLTHFAILLSPRPPQFSESTVLSLSIISYIGVTISVVAMILTIIVFIMLSTKLNNRPLLTIRNYIHINLCISLAIAQITFVAGVDKTGPPNNDVNIHCSIIAVLLQYFFLVSFMWMLMEGVVLYLALVKLFVSQKYRYILAFTLMSYGIPLLYMGMLTIPLGFSLSGGHYYGYNRACFLNPETYFIWAFIAPVIFIFLTNIGFFIMAARISWKQHMKRVNNKKALKFMNWFKSTIPLMVVMGLNWIIGLLVVEVKELAPLAYISTIMSAFQGVFIFVSLVVLSKGVRDECKKWWISKRSLKNSTISLDSSNKSATMELHKERRNPSIKEKNSSNTENTMVILNSGSSWK